MDACNYDADATADDGGCDYAMENYDCEGNCTAETDCNGECGGSAEVDECGVCGGGNADMDNCGVCFGGNADDMGCGCFEPGPSGCDVTCGSTLEFDECGECGGDGIPNWACDCVGNVEDCAGECGGSAEEDECGECGGDGIDEDACDCAGNVEDCAGVCGGSAENCPDWVDNPGGYEFTSTISGGVVLNEGVQLGECSELNEDGDICLSNADQFAAFDINGNVRGIGVILFPPFGPYADTPIWEVQLRSNSAGDLLSFKYYDSSQDEVLDIAETYEFVINDIIGDVINPQEYNIQYEVDLSIELIEGWNWISFNVDPENASLASVLEGIGEAATFIQSQSSGTANNYGAYGWYGALTELDPTQMYILQMSEPATLTITGVPVDVATRPIDLITGWNWIGYLPQYSGDVETAFASVSDFATFVQSQSSGTANNYGEYGWYGALTTLEPGSGYLLEMSDTGTLTYPEFSGTARLGMNKQPVLLNDTTADWNFNYAEFQFIGAITVSIEDREDNVGDLVGAFVNGECRGIAERMYFPYDDSYMYILQVYSNIEGEELTFKYYDSVNDEVVEYRESITFENYMVVGDGFDTYALSSVDMPAPDDYNLEDAYPNPFNPSTELSFSIMDAGNITLNIYDMMGRLVNTLVDGHLENGYHSVIWDGIDSNGNAVSSGMYIYALQGEGLSITKKMVLMK
jgi:hypothetical protein